MFTEFELIVWHQFGKSHFYNLTVADEGGGIAAYKEYNGRVIDGHEIECYRMCDKINAFGAGTSSGVRGKLKFCSLNIL